MVGERENFPVKLHVKNGLRYYNCSQIFFQIKQ